MEGKKAQNIQVSLNLIDAEGSVGMEILGENSLFVASCGEFCFWKKIFEGEDYRSFTSSVLGSLIKTSGIELSLEGRCVNIRVHLVFVLF